MFHRPPRPEDNTHNIICGKGIKVLLENLKKKWASLKEAWSPLVFFSLSYFLFQADPSKRKHGGSLRSLICLGF